MTKMPRVFHICISPDVNPVVLAVFSCGITTEVIMTMSTIKPTAALTMPVIPLRLKPKNNFLSPPNN